MSEYQLPTLRRLVFKACLSVVAISALFAISAVRCQAQPLVAANAAKVEALSLGDTKNVHAIGNLIVAGQFEESDLPAINELDVVQIITLRTNGEIDWDEKEICQEHDFEFREIPFRAPSTLTDEVFEQSSNLIAEAYKRVDGKTILHCGSANRVGAVWLPYRVLNDGVPLEKAVAEARTIGLKTPEYELKAIAYIKRKMIERATRPDEASVRPGINDNFLDPDLNPQEWVDRFEVESREVFDSRQEVVEACGLQSDWRIADIGAGTGIYTRLFSEAAADGWVYAIEISPRFLEHIHRQCRALDQKNVTTVLCPEDSIGLPEDSINMAFVCDTYHHFEFPESTLASTHSALKEGGVLIVIDFERIPGSSRDWVVNHVRAGKETFRSEIEKAGFKFVEEIEISGFSENYCLKFEKTTPAE